MLRLPAGRREVVWVPTFLIATCLGSLAALIAVRGSLAHGALPLGLAITAVLALGLALLELRILSRASEGEVVVRTVFRSTRLPADAAVLELTHRIQAYDLVLVAHGVRTTLLSWYNVASIRRLIVLARRIGLALKLPLHVDPALTEALDLQQRSFRTARWLIPVILAFAVALAVALQVLLFR